ncbi:MAG: histidine triad nucleotide-binding protein [Clostridiaceae bacterium]
MDDCLFCKIIKGDIPSTKVYEDDKVYCFRDIAPGAPVHFLTVPKKHIATINDLTQEDSELVAHAFMVMKKLAAEMGIAEKGYRVVSNCGEDGGQSVPHIHFHLLGGRSLQWPPG